MIPWLKKLWWSLWWDEASAGRTARALLLAIGLGIQPLLADILSGKTVTPGQWRASVALAVVGILVGWLRAGEPNVKPDVETKPSV